MIVPVMDLIKLDESALNKMTKAELIASIKKDAWYPSHYKDEVAKLNKMLVEGQVESRAACIMLAAFVGKVLDVADYSGRVKTENLNILELVGLVAAKCSSIGRS